LIHLLGPGPQIGITVWDSCVRDSCRRVCYHPPDSHEELARVSAVRKFSGAVLRGCELESSTAIKRAEMKILSEPSIRDRTLPQVGARCKRGRQPERGVRRR